MEPWWIQSKPMLKITGVKGVEKLIKIDTF